MKRIPLAPKWGRQYEGGSIARPDMHSSHIHLLRNLIGAGLAETSFRLAHYHHVNPIEPTSFNPGPDVDSCLWWSESPEGETYWMDRFIRMEDYLDWE